MFNKALNHKLSHYSLSRIFLIFLVFTRANHRYHELNRKLVASLIDICVRVILNYFDSDTWIICVWMSRLALCCVVFQSFRCWDVRQIRGMLELAINVLTEQVLEYSINNHVRLIPMQPVVWIHLFHCVPYFDIVRAISNLHTVFLPLSFLELSQQHLNMWWSIFLFLAANTSSHLIRLQLRLLTTQWRLLLLLNDSRALQSRDLLLHICNI